MTIKRKVAYVTGGMGGIGTSLCQRLHQDGFTVIAGCGPSRDHAKWLGEQAALGFTFHGSVGNVGDWDSTVAAFEKVKAEHGPVDVLVNNAGEAVALLEAVLTGLGTTTPFDIATNRVWQIAVGVFTAAGRPERAEDARRAIARP